MHDHLTFIYLFCFILSTQERSTLYFCFLFTVLIKYLYKSSLFDAWEVFIVQNWILFSIWWKQGNFHLLSSSFVFFFFLCEVVLLWGSFFVFFCSSQGSKMFLWIFILEAVVVKKSFACLLFFCRRLFQENISKEKS